MLGNFDFMVSDAYGDAYPSYIYSPCEKAERYFADGDYQTSIAQCRTALESIVQWMYSSDDFPELSPAFYNTLDEKMHAPAFRQILHDSWLLNKLDNVRLLGNLAVHNGNGDFSRGNALACLSNVYDLMLNIEAQLWENPHTEPFFEPFYEQEEWQPVYEQPVYRDLPTLLAEAKSNSDAEAAAKLALLISHDDPTIDLEAYARALPKNTPIRDLIAMLIRPNLLNARINAGPFKVTSLISRCYSDYPWWEKDIIFKLCTQASRKHVVETEAQIEEMLQKLAAIQ